MYSNRLQLQFILVLLAGLLILSFFILQPFLAPLFLAAIFATVLHPLYLKLLNKLADREVIAAMVMVLVSVICILVPLTFLTSQIFQETSVLYTSLIQNDSSQNVLYKTLGTVGVNLEGVFPGTGKYFSDASMNIDAYAKQVLTWIVQNIGVAFSSASKLFLDLFVFFISLYYLIKDGPKLKRAIIQLSPLENKDDNVVFDRLEMAVNSVLKGSLLVAITQGILTGIGFAIFGVPNGFLWGTITIFAALIPGIGTALVIVPGVIYLLLTGHTIAAIALLAWGMIIVGLVDNIMRPKLVGRDLQLHPLFVLFSVLGGVVYFGPIGIFLGPLVVSLLFAFLSTYSYLINKVSAPTT